MLEKLHRILLIGWMTVLISTIVAMRLAAERIAEPSVEYIKKLSFGNLRKLNLRGGNGQYILNNVQLAPVSSNTVDFSTANRSCRVRATFLKTVQISNSRPVSAGNQGLVRRWALEIPLVAHILTEQDSFGSIKPVVYELIDPKGKEGLHLQEEIVLLWSADPVDDPKIGETRLLPPMPFPGKLVDIQYRGVKAPATHLVGKIILQILYVREQGQTPATLGAFVIVSKPSGEFEFHVVPRSLLDQIVIGRREH